MRSPERVLCGLLIVALVRLASLAEAQTIQWIYDYSQAKSDQRWVPASGGKELRCILDKSFREEPWVGEKASLAWVEPAETAERTFTQLKSFAVALGSARQSVDTVELLLRDLRPETGQSVLEGIKRAYPKARSKPFFLVTRTSPISTGKPVTDVREIRNEEELSKGLAEIVGSGRSIRYVILKRAVAIAVVPPDAEKRRWEVGAKLIDAGTLASRLQAGNSWAAKALIESTDRAFDALIGENLLDDRLSVYEIRWRYLLRNELVRGMKSAATIADTQLFFASIVPAIMGDKRTVTVTVSASRGSDAVVKYAKAADAAKGVFGDLGLTVLTRELERARFVFRTLREGKQTGEVTWDCTSGPFCVVNVPESP